MSTIIAPTRDPAALPPSSSVGWLSRLRATREYDLAVRLVGSAWFLLLALLLVRRAFADVQAMSFAHFGPSGWIQLLASLCVFLFYLALWWFILIRPSPAARADGILPSFIAFAGSYLPLAIVWFAPGGTSTGQKLSSMAFLLTGTALMVVVICHLGRSFSIVPQARSLVRTGPYAIVRNPLYLAEGVATVGTVIQCYSLLTLVLFLTQCALQIGRIFYEENLLRHSFADYDDYARTTPRLIPYLW